uniref:GDT1 family protein n=1 Tax=Manihot esculenta TaxID=3983 RepID=A0A2C9USH3_MANES
MGFRSFLILLSFFLLLALPYVAAKDSEVANEKEESTVPLKDLGRRGMIVTGDLDVNSVGLGLQVDSGLGIFDAFIASLSMIIVSEIGDETFIIAALMAMRHPKSIVLSGALSALIVMTVLSTGLGRIVPNLISRKHTNSAATVLYAFFGLRLLYIAWRSDSKSSQKKEMEEVEEKLEAGQGKTTFRRFFSRFCTPIFLESFILTFLAEWGDRSQIATIALATHKNAIGVAVGATLGHTVCTSLAVVGGSMLASKISQGTVAMIGGLLFLGFSLHHQSLSSGYSHHETQAELLHAYVIKNGSLQNLAISNYLLNLYVKKCQNLYHAHQLFNEILTRDIRTWTILISGFAQYEDFKMVLYLFRKMQSEGICPNHFTLSSVFKCCSTLCELRNGKAIHGWILTNEIGLDVILVNSVLDLYVKCGALDYAKRLFKSVEEIDTVSWNIMISAYLHIGDVERALDLFHGLNSKDVTSWNTIIDGLMKNGFERTSLELLYKMLESGHMFNAVTFSIALNLVSCLSLLELGKQIHGQVLRLVLHNNGFIRNSLLGMYCKCGKMEEASMTLRTIPVRISCDDSLADVVSWSSMISGYVRNGEYEIAFQTFRFMVNEHVVVDKFTLTSIVSACASKGILELGMQVHAHIQKIGHKVDAHLYSSLIDMYAKCGSLNDAIKIFKQINDLNVVLWTSMISGFGLHGQGHEAIELFECMMNEGIIPNEITFIGVLIACNHAGLLEEGCKYFELMQKVYDLYGRSGRLNEAKEFIQENGISHVSAVLKSFLSSCRLHKNVEMGNWASERLLKLEQSDAGSYILLSNMYSTDHRWEEAANVRSSMQQRKANKLPGLSWIQLKNQVHNFN